MKRFSLLLALVYGMHSGAFAQIEASKTDIVNTDKWVITANNLKAAPARLVMDYPAGTRWVIYVYTMAGNKYINSFSYKEKINLSALSPGTYRITLNNVPVLNIPIEKGKDTRLKYGILDISRDAVWYLHDEKGKTYYTSGNKPEKLALPVGNYILKVGGTSQLVVVKEEGMNLEADDDAIDEPDKWVITPLPETEKMPLKEESGMLDVNFPRDSFYTIWPEWQHHTWELKISRTGYPDILLSSDDFKDDGIIKSVHRYPLTPGKYHIKLNNVLIENVPIESNKLTRIKTGTLKLNFLNSSPGSPETMWYVLKDTIFPPNLNVIYPQFLYREGWAICRLTLPLGKYILRTRGTYPFDKIIIKDRKITSRDLVFYTRHIIAGVSWSLMDKDVSCNIQYAEGSQYNPNGTKSVHLPKGIYRLIYKDYTGKEITKMVEFGDEYSVYVDNNIRIP